VEQERLHFAGREREHESEHVEEGDLGGDEPLEGPEWEGVQENVEI